jgi:glycosyltransferase involved in cell wall biosynthesis
MPPTVRLVVPCFNEASRLDVAAFTAQLAADPAIAFTFVDDGSGDDTRARLEAVARAAPDRVDVVVLPENRGKGEAVRAGLRAALAHGPDFAGWWDADLATPFDEVARLVAALDARPGTWLAMGARVQALGARIERRASRHYAGRLIATRISRTLRMPTYDTQCGAKLFRVATLPPGLLDAPFLTRWLFDVEVIARLIRRHRDGLGPDAATLVVEVPLRRWTDVPGSKVRATDFVRAWFGLRRLRRHYGL